VLRITKKYLGKRLVSQRREDRAPSRSWTTGVEPVVVPGGNKINPNGGIVKVVTAQARWAGVRSAGP